MLIFPSSKKPNITVGRSFSFFALNCHWIISNYYGIITIYESMLAPDMREENGEVLALTIEIPSARRKLTSRKEYTGNNNGKGYTLGI